MERVMRRRAILGGGAAVAGATLAAALLFRKRGGGAPDILRPAVAQEAARLQDLSGVAPTDPPATPPDVTLTDGEGATHRLGDFRGKGVVLNLWATWCVPCVAELPALATLTRRAADQGLVVLPLSSDRGGAPVVRKFFAAHGIEGLPVWVDPKGEAALAFGARGIPTTVLIDHEGRERGRMEGAADWGSDAALARLKALLLG